MNERTQFLGRAGHVAGWEFLIAPGDDILATNGDRVIRHTPKNYGTSLLELMSRPTAAVAENLGMTYNRHLLEAVLLFMPGAEQAHAQSGI